MCVCACANTHQVGGTLSDLAKFTARVAWLSPPTKQAQLPKDTKPARIFPKT